MTDFVFWQLLNWESGKYWEQSMKSKSFLGIAKQNSLIRLFFEYLCCTAYIYISWIYLYYIVLEDSFVQ